MTKAKGVFRTIGWAWVPVVCLAVWAGGADAAQTVHLTLTIDGNQIQCESTVVSMDREGTAEGLSFGSTIIAEIDPASGQPTGRRVHRPIVFRKRIDKCSPLLIRALVQAQPVEGAFRFYRPTPGGDGTEEQFFTVTIKLANVVGVSTVSPDVLDPAAASMPAFEEVSFVYQEIEFTYEPDGVTTDPIPVGGTR